MGLFPKYFREVIGFEGDGEVFAVDPGNGNDSFSGLQRGKAKKTMQAAIDLCVAGRGDVILRYPGGEEVTTPVLFNKSGITVKAITYGINQFASGEIFATYGAAALTDEPAGIVTERCKLEGLGFVSQDTGALFYSGAALLIGGEADATPFGVHVKNCRFPKWNLANRIGLAVEGSSDVLIEECDFEGVGTNFAAGIYVQGACANITIRRNHFRDCDQGILFGTFAGGGPDFIIKENIAVHGSLLSAPSAAVGAVIGNYIPTLDVANAYAGDSLATLEGRGLWFADNHYSETP